MLGDDAAYPGGPTLAKGFTGTPLTRQQDHFNCVLSGVRITVERAFGRLKGRWKILQKPTSMGSLERTLDYIGACCILHNLCEERAQYFKENWNNNVEAEHQRQAKEDLREYDLDEGVNAVLRDGLFRHGM